jgi:taurine dioxygenase
LSARKLNDTFGAELSGVNLSQPLADVALREIEAAFHRYSVLLFRDQTLTPEQHIAFTRRLGTLEIHVQTNFLLPGHPEIFVLSNIREYGRLIGGVDCALSWHSDSSYLAVPSLGSALYAIEVPPVGAETWFAGMSAPYETLPQGRQHEIGDLRAIHSYLRLQQKQFPDRPLTEEQLRKAPDIDHPVVRVHPATGRKSLYLGGEVISGVQGMAPDEGIGLMRELLAFATQDEFTYCHHWRAGDLVVWDNRCTVHRGSKYDTERYRRRMHRTTLAGTEPPLGL